MAVACPITGIKPEASEALWYALEIWTGRESSTCEMLINRGYRCLLPTYKKRKQTSRRREDVDAPLFPGYLFCYFDVTKRLEVLKTPGVIRIVSFGKTAVPIREGEIESLRVLTESRVSASPLQYFNEGEEVSVVSGPIAGMSGKVLRAAAGCLLVISVTLLQRSVSVAVDPLWLASSRDKTPGRRGDLVRPTTDLSR